MTEMSGALFKHEKKQLIQLTYNVVVHSNEMAYRKRGRLGLDPIHS